MTKVQQGVGFVNLPMILRYNTCMVSNQFDRLCSRLSFPIHAGLVTALCTCIASAEVHIRLYGVTTAPQHDGQLD